MVKLGFNTYPPGRCQGRSVLWDYFKKSIVTRHRLMSLIYNPQYKMEILEFLFNAKGRARSSSYKKRKLHFQHVYGDYSRRAALIKNCHRVKVENKRMIDTLSRS